MAVGVLITLAIFQMFAAPPAQNAQQHLAAARAFELKQNYAKAGEEYQKVLALRPDDAVIHQSLALTFHLRNQFDHAIPEFKRALDLDPNLWGSLLFLGIDSYKTNQFAAAIGFLQQSMKLNAAQSEPEARFWLGASEAALGHYAEAIEHYRRAAELRPRDIEVLYQLAEAYDAQGSALFAQIGHIEPRAAAVYLLQAERFAAENRAELAARDYRRAITLRPDFKGGVPALERSKSAEPATDLVISEADARANFGLAQYLYAQGDSKGSVELLTHLSSLKPSGEGAARYTNTARQGLPDDSGWWVRLTEARSKADAHFGEDSLLRTLLQEDPRNLDALLALGRTYKRWAQVLLDRMAQISPDSARVHQLQGEQQESKSEYESAIQSYQTALARNAEQSGLRYAIGNVYWKMHQSDSAERWLNAELKRNPYHSLAHLRLGSLYTEQSKPDEAIPHLQEALRFHPEWIDARMDLGRALAQKGRYSVAITELQKVAAADTANDRVHYLLSNALRKLGRDKEAATEMTRYQELTRQRLERAQQSVGDVTSKQN